MGERQLPPTYKVVKTEAFIEQFSALKKIYKRMDDLLNGIYWALSRHPHRFNKLTGDYYLWVTGNVDNDEIPKVQILYIIIEEHFQVTLLGIDDIV